MLQKEGGEGGGHTRVLGYSKQHQPIVDILTLVVRWGISKKRHCCGRWLWVIVMWSKKEVTGMLNGHQSKLKKSRGSLTMAKNSSQNVIHQDMTTSQKSTGSLTMTSIH